MKGVYCLIMTVNENINPKIGALGKIKFKKGNYVYVGSAQNNVEKRIARHKRKNKKIKWHIDHLLANPNVKIEKTVYKKANKQEECRIAGLLNKFGQPIKNFGSSDCSCYSHLFKLKSLKDLNKLKLKEI